MRGNHQNENTTGNEAQPDQALRGSEFSYRRHPTTRHTPNEETRRA
jgi:hypothetical protein